MQKPRWSASVKTCTQTNKQLTNANKHQGTNKNSRNAAKLCTECCSSQIKMLLKFERRIEFHSEQIFLYFKLRFCFCYHAENVFQLKLHSSYCNNFFVAYSALIKFDSPCFTAKHLLFISFAPPRVTCLRPLS